MSITVTFANDTADGILSDLQRIFPALVAGTPLPPMQDQPVREPATAPKEPTEVIPPKKTRGAAAKLAAADKVIDETGEVVKDRDAPLADAPAAETRSSSASSEGEASSSASTAASVVDLDTLRAKLKQVGATDGLGHDKVFEILGKYGVKTASTVPEDKRADVVADLDAALAEVK